MSACPHDPPFPILPTTRRQTIKSRRVTAPMLQFTPSRRDQTSHAGIDAGARRGALALSHEWKPMSGVAPPLRLLRHPHRQVYGRLCGQRRRSAARRHSESSGAAHLPRQHAVVMRSGTGKQPLEIAEHSARHALLDRGGDRALLHHIARYIERSFGGCRRHPINEPCVYSIAWP
jgi:hypothetical protein